jgi:hypothetical protein
MPDALITGDASNFGSIAGTLAGDAGTVAGSVTGLVTGTLEGSVGVPGAAGVGVPSGGTTGQVLKKASDTSYDTVWGVDSTAVAWGGITGTLSSQTDLQTALDLKAPLASPALTGNPTAPTAATGDNDTSIATTAFVQQELAAGTAVAKNLEVYVRNQTGATLAAGTIVYINGATGNRPTVTKAQANNDANSAQTFGFVKTSIANNGFGYVIVRGECENLDTSALTEGQQLYLSPTTAGTWTTTKPSAPDHLVYVGIVVRSHPTLGVILVAIQNGYELDEIHDVKITSVSNGQVLKYDSAQGLWVNGTDSSGVAWGGITGTLSNQTDLQTALDAKAPLASPALTGTPTAPTAAVDTNTTQVATTAYVIGQGYLKSATASSTYAPLASPSLTGTPTAPTAAAATNTTQIATTAFVQQEVPAASTSTAGKVQLATFTTPGLTTTTTAVSPRVMMDHIMHPGFINWGVRGSTSTSGAGAAIATYSTRIAEILGPNTATAGYAMAIWDTSGLSMGMLNMTRGVNGAARKWNSPIWASGRGQYGYPGNTSFNGDANCTVRVSIGGKSSVGSGNISVNEPGFGFYFVPGSALVLQVSKGDGSALTDVTSSFTPVVRESFDWKAYSDGAGNVTLFINDSQVATTTAGPSTSSAESFNFYFEMVEQTASAAARIIWMSVGPKIYWGV